MTAQLLATHLGLGSLLHAFERDLGGFAPVDHWTQGEFHHDVVLRAHDPARVGGAVVVVATNCNGGVKEVLVFDDVPDRWALWHARCPDNPAFAGALPSPRSRAVTSHWFDPCELLAGDARSELKPTCRKPARGGGWEPTS